MKQAEDLANYDQYLDITGCDIDHRMVEISKANSFEAGLGDLVEFKQMQVRDISTRKEYGVIVGNPPYGERLGEGLEWVIISGQLGTELWSAEVVFEIQEEYTQLIIS